MLLCEQHRKSNAMVLSHYISCIRILHVILLCDYWQKPVYFKSASGKSTVCEKSEISGKMFRSAGK